MELKNFFAQDDQGNLLGGATCYLYARGTENLAASLQAANGTALANPFTADASGLIQFAAPNGLYDLRVVKGVRDYRVRVQCLDVEESVAEAEAAAGRAEVARDAAQLSAGVFADTAAGLAATTSGKYFSVPSAESSEFLVLYRNNAGVAQEVKRYPSSSAVATAVAELLDQVGRGPQVKNLFDLSRSTDGFYINTVGSLSQNAAYFVSDFIPVLPGIQYSFAKSVPHVCLYGAHKQVLQYLGTVSAETPLTTTSDTAFIRFSDTLSTGKSYQMLIKGVDIPSAYMGFGYRDPVSQDRTSHRGALDLIQASIPAVRNLFDLNRITEGQALSTSGSLYAAAGYFVSSMIPVKPGVSYIMSGSSGVMCFYDQYQKNISHQAVSASQAFSVPSDGCFLRFQMTPLTAKNSLMLVEGNVLPTQYLAFGYTTSADVAKAALEASRATTDSSWPAMRNLFDLNRALVDTAISTLNGAIYAAAGYFVTDKLPVTPGGTYVANQASNAVVFLGIDGKFISSLASAAANTPIAVPASAYYVRFQVYGLQNRTSLMVTAGSTIPTGYVPFGGSASKLPWQDKKLVVLGDSISATGLYIPALLAGTGMSMLANHAVAGRPVREMGKTAAGVTLNEADLTNADVVSIFGGTNDYGGGRTLGTLADAYDGSSAATFYNDVYQLLNLLYTLKPTIRVVFSTPLKRGAFQSQPVFPAANGIGVKLDQYVDAIREVCELFAVPVCDLFRVSGINLKNLGSYTSDNLHPNAAGSALHVRPMIATLNAA